MMFYYKTIISFVFCMIITTTLQAPTDTGEKAPAAVTFTKIKETLGLQLPPLGNVTIESLPLNHEMGDCKVHGKFEHIQMIGLKDCDLDVEELTPYSTKFTATTPNLHFKGVYALNISKCAETIDGEKSGGFEFNLLNLTIKMALNITEKDYRQIDSIDMQWSVSNVTLEADNLFNNAETGAAFQAVINDYGTTFLNMVPPDAKFKFQERVKTQLNSYFATHKKQD